ncbi:MAG: hypothetical protein EB078_00100 [Proteobacteria bacterium]|nr:hypothetical protein [Pseudomonadota bacterium]NDC24260.1 hypothetical protein [Pseudomonadota bacterium]NDD03281.1 hypothetical protein [Pseudomonadota bacterium]
MTLFRKLAARAFLGPSPILFTAIFVVSCGQNPSEVRFQPLTQVPQELITENVQIESTLSQDLAFLRKDNGRRGLIKRFLLAKPQFKQLKSGALLPEVAESKILSQQGRPRVLLLSQTFQIPVKSQAKLVLANPEVEISESNVPLAKSEKLLVWGKKTVELTHEELENYYPGKFFEAHQVGRQLKVTLYPIQVERKSGKIILLTGGHWKLEVAEEKSGIDQPGVAPAVIITSEKLLEKAKELQKFHREALNVLSDIVTVEAISEKEAPVDLEQLPKGYKNSEGFRKKVKAYDPEKGTGYNFELARKIIQFLRSRSEQSSQLKYVVLLGNSEIVPPSYYFSLKSDDENASGVTDQCYSAGKLCLEPKLAVGRLPFREPSEVDRYLDKAKRWFKLRGTENAELSLYGGKAFKSSPVYIGELGTLQTLETKHADWNRVSKHFQTDGQFSRKQVLELVSGQDNSSLVYFLDHGTGNRWFSGDEYVSSREILDLSPNEKSAPPLMVSVACVNAAFDEDLLMDDTLTHQSSSGDVSIGTALVKSSQGAIAYLGGARDGLGSPEYEVDEQGNVQVLGTSYGLQMLDGFVEQSRTHRGERIGDGLLGALRAYAFENGNDMKSDANQWTYFITELLGDPLLPLPEVRERAQAHPSAELAFKEFDNSTGFPRLVLSPVARENMSLPVLSSESAVTAKVFALQLDENGFNGEKLIKTVDLSTGENSIVLDSEKDLSPGQQYVIRLINRDGIPREKHVVFSTRESLDKE